jgi:hypothetical protein
MSICMLRVCRNAFRKLLWLCLEFSVVAAERRQLRVCGCCVYSVLGLCKPWWY